jgi:lycopene cyclase domain-containing protein
MVILLRQKQRAGMDLPSHLNAFPPSIVLAAHVVVAVLYTTPWDNYLVATGVWWYDPDLVIGLLLGWVPVEEYAFFILQTLMTGSFLILLLYSLRSDSEVNQTNSLIKIRTLLLMAGLAIWLVSLAMLVIKWQPGTYLALILIWALPPILFQLWFGLDILNRERRAVFFTITTATVYLALADTLAIRAGTWTIDPAQSTGLLLGSLPIEEFVFFLVTNTLVTFGVTLVLARASQSRVPAPLLKLLGRRLPAAESRRLTNV